MSQLEENFEKFDLSRYVYLTGFLLLCLYFISNKKISIIGFYSITIQWNKCISKSEHFSENNQVNENCAKKMPAPPSQKNIK